VRLSARSGPIRKRSKGGRWTGNEYCDEIVAKASGTEPSTHELLTVYETEYFVQDLTKNGQRRPLRAIIRFRSRHHELDSHCVMQHQNPPPT
jgi:hypothetical protein